jgi:ribonuclease D
MRGSRVAPALISDARSLDEPCDQLAAEPVYDFDTECHTERTFYPQLALIQVACRARWR